MAGNESSAFQLSDEARALIKAAEDRAQAAERKAEELSEKVGGLLNTANVNRAEAFIAELKAMKLDEEHGFSGMLREIEQVMLADDGGAALQSDHFADDKNRDGFLTVSDALRRVFGALKTAEGSTLKLGEVVAPPSEKLDDDSRDHGKPPKGDEEVDLSEMTDEQILALDDPAYRRQLGITDDRVASNGGGEQK